MGFALLSRHFEESRIPDEMPAFLPDDWKGGVALLAMVFVLSSRSGVNLIRTSCVSSAMTTDVDGWRKDPAAKAEDIAQEIERLAHRAGATGLSVTSYILQLAVAEARKEAGDRYRQKSHTQGGVS